MSFKFEKLNIWNVALDLSVEIGEIANQFPDIGKYCLSIQIRRASDSVVLNIAEGCTGQSNPEFVKFLRYSLRSAIEVVSCLFIAKRKRYIDDKCFNLFYQRYEHLCKMISSLTVTLK